jgi:hypothetical protein
MYRRRRSQAAESRSGIILLVVLAMLTLFAVVGLAFVFYADAEAVSARHFREAESLTQPDVNPEQAFSYFLSQLIFPVGDTDGIYSALRGHDLSTLKFGNNETFFFFFDSTPWNGFGRLHEEIPVPLKDGTSVTLDGYDMINYTYFRDDPDLVPQNKFLRDPERLGVRDGKIEDPITHKITVVNPLSKTPNQYTAGFNVPYTYPDLNNMFLGVINPRTGQVVLPSFHRPWLFGPLAQSNPNWTNWEGKYKILRPRPKEMGPGFPYPEDAGGDVKNLVGAPGGNDSLWMDLGAPVMTLPDGRKVKMLFAPLVIDLDGRVNVNAHGNIRAIAPVTDKSGKVIAELPTHASNQGWGLWEVNLQHVLNKQVSQTFGGSTVAVYEWPNLFLGIPSPKRYGKYGADGVPNNATAVAGAGRAPRFFSQVDFDACQADTKYRLMGGKIRLPDAGFNPFSPFPTFPTGYDNGSGGGALTERFNHPLLYDVGSLISRGGWYDSTNDDRYFTAGDMAALLRPDGDTNKEALTSELLKLCPTNFSDPAVRQLVTTHSFDTNQPGASPWVYQYPALTPYRVPPTTPTAAPRGPAIPFPSTILRLNEVPQDSDFRTPGIPPKITIGRPPRTIDNPSFDFLVDWRRIATAFSRIDLNRTFVQYPHQALVFDPVTRTFRPMVGPNDRFDTIKVLKDARGRPIVDPTTGDFLYDESIPSQYANAVRDRQNFANTIYRQLLSVTGVPRARDPVNPTEAELQVRRWLAQLAVNVVDFLDEDDIPTPFNFYTESDAYPNGRPSTAPPFDTGATTTGRAEALGGEIQWPRYWVFGTELPQVVLNEAHAQIFSRTVNNDQPQVVRLFVELHNAFPDRFTGSGVAQLQQTDKDPRTLSTQPVPAGPDFESILGVKRMRFLFGSPSSHEVLSPITTARNGYAPYRITSSAQNGPIPSGPFNENVLGNPGFITAGGVFQPQVRSNTTDSDFLTAANIKTMAGAAQPTIAGIPSPYILPQPQTPTKDQTQGFFLLGPRVDTTRGDPQHFAARDPFTAANSPTVPSGTPVLRTDNMSYSRVFNAVSPPDERALGISLALRRVVNPHLPFDPRRTLTIRRKFLDFSVRPPVTKTVDTLTTNPFYNPYMTTDYMEQVPLAETRLATDFATRGKRQPYASHASQVADQTPLGSAREGFRIAHTFGRPNAPDPLWHYYNWLVHLDRQVINPMELLHVSGYQPYQLTHQFITGNTAAQRFTHLAPWFDEQCRLYRLLEFVEARDRSSASSFDFAGRRPGRINLNTVWDESIFKALCDARAEGDPTNPNYFDATDVSLIYKQMVALRTPGGAFNFSRLDRPFQSLAAGYSLVNDPRTNPDPQHPLRGSGINDTFLRAFAADGGLNTQRLFQIPAVGRTTPPPAPLADNHPYIKNQLLTKIFNNVTVRSNVFAVWVTVGFFEVTDDSVRPVKLGAELGRAQNRHVRHRMFAIVDRSNLGFNWGPQPKFRPHDQPLLVPYFAIID